MNDSNLQLPHVVDGPRSPESFSTTCQTIGCPGFGEELRACANPDHLDVMDEIGPLFHSQRDGEVPCHGVKRRGQPRRLCGIRCADCVARNFYLNDDGSYSAAERLWEIEGRIYRTYDQARRRVGFLIAREVVAPRSDLVRFYLTPIKTVAGSQSILEGSGYTS